MKKTLGFMIIFFSIATLCISENRISKTDSLYEVLKTQHGNDKVWTIIELGNELSNSNPDSAIVLYNTSAIESQRNNNNIGIVESYTKIASALIIKNDYNKAIEYCNRAYNALANKNDKKCVGDIYNNLGLAYEQLGHSDSSIIYENRAMLLYETIGYEKGIISSSVNLGNSYYQLSDYTTALDYFFNAQQHLEGNQTNKISLSIVFNDIANVYVKLSILDKSLDYYNKCYNIYKELNLEGKLSETMNNIGETYLRMKNFNKANETLDKSLKIASEAKNSFLKSVIILNLGNLSLEEGSISNAEEYYKKAYLISDSLNDMYGIAIYQKNMGKLLAKKSNYNYSFQLLNKALVYFNDQNMLEETKEIYLIKSNAFKSKGEYKKALENYERYILISDSIGRREMNYFSTSANLKLISNKEIEKLRKQNETVGMSNLRLKYIIISLIVALSMILLVIYIVLTKNKIIKKSKKEIFLRNEKIDEIHEKILVDLNNSLIPISTYIFLKKGSEESKYLESSFDAISNYIKETIDLIRRRV